MRLCVAVLVITGRVAPPHLLLEAKRVVVLYAVLLSQLTHHIEAQAAAPFVLPLGPCLLSTPGPLLQDHTVSVC